MLLIIYKQYIIRNYYYIKSNKIKNFVEVTGIYYNPAKAKCK